MTKVWKLPAGIDIATVNSLIGDEGSSLNAIEDIHGNYILSQEEYWATEFQKFKIEYADVYQHMVEIDYEPKPTPEWWPIEQELT